MTTYVKPSVRKAWAEAATIPANLADPGDTAVGTGWPSGATPPSRQWFNWVLNWCANAVRYFMQRGLVDYDAAETYGIGAIVIGPDNLVYCSLVTPNIGHTPSSSPTQWGSVKTMTPATADNSTAIATTAWGRLALLVRANNLADLTSPSTARVNLGLAPIAASGSASDLTTGSIPNARVPVGAVTQYQANLAIAGGQVTSKVATAGVADVANVANSATSATTAGSATTAATATKLTTATGAAPSYSARAWVTFAAAGTILAGGGAAGNVASVTHFSTGHWTVNFQTAMPSANYAIAGAAENVPPNFDAVLYLDTQLGVGELTTSCGVAVDQQTGAAMDSTRVSVIFFN